MSDLEPWRFCPRCAGELNRGDGFVDCRDCGAREYGNPAPTVSAIPIDASGRLLLARRAREPRAGLWDALGGFVEPGEDATDALVRELREETGAEFIPLAFLGGFADTYGPGGPPNFNLYWTARLISGDLVASDDVSELRWFEADELPSLHDLAFPNNARALAAALNTRSVSAAPATSEKRSKPGLFEIQLVTEALDRLVAFYAETVCLTMIVDDRERGRVHFSLDHGQLILARSLSEDASPSWPGLPPPLLVSEDPRGPTPPIHGPVHFAFGVTGAELLAEGERLRREGLDVRGPFRWPDGYRSSYFHDPDANVVELIAPPTQ
jgi:ADP-ribose pyrophosphatase YjhB (NUDIX family)